MSCLTTKKVKQINKLNLSKKKYRKKELSLTEYTDNYIKFLKFIKKQKCCNINDCKIIKNKIDDTENFSLYLNLFRSKNPNMSDLFDEDMANLITGIYVKNAKENINFDDYEYMKNNKEHFEKQIEDEMKKPKSKRCYFFTKKEKKDLKKIAKNFATKKNKPKISKASFKKMKFWK